MFMLHKPLFSRVPPPRVYPKISACQMLARQPKRIESYNSSDQHDGSTLYQMVIVFIGMDSERSLHLLFLAEVEQAEVEQAEAHRRSHGSVFVATAAGIIDSDMCGNGLSQCAVSNRFSAWCGNRT